MATYVQQNQSRRMAIFGLIVGFHILLGYALVSGLARKVVEVVAPPLVTDIIEEIKPEDKPPPPPPPQIERPPVQVPPPDVVIDIPMESSTTAISNVTDRPVPVAAPPAPVVVARSPAKIGRMPSSEDYYPAASKRAEEQGTVTVKVCVDAKGKIIGNPTVVTSSGFERLDEGGVKLARAGRYQPGTAGGQPQDESCVSFRVKFEIK
ncbi:MAG: energy transducer TonB [Gammaproteobacteria bacterium]|jgi:protein TonB|nr:energy transducer TonB [Gammaproteobacteria bacterium]